MVGQKNLIKQIDWMCKADCFPRFCIIVGENGKQEKELAVYIANQLQAFVSQLPDNKIDTVRQVITEAYKVYKPMVYIFNNADDMSLPAKNALLKVTEEPPNNAFFIMLLTDLNNTLDTIRSRAVQLKMEPYCLEDLKQYFESNWQATDKYKKLVLDLSETPNDIDILQTQVEVNAADKFYAYVAKVVDNIGTVSGANSFKIADKVALKDEPEKYDLKMFWRACCKLFHDKAMSADDYIAYWDASKKTSDVLKKLGIRGVNKQMLFDEWLLNVREVLR